MPPNGIIGDTHGVRMEYTQILNGVLTTNEFIHLRREETNESSFSKINIAKAYDHAHVVFFLIIYSREWIYR